MADKLPNLGNFNIPTSVIDTHEWATDSFIDTLGKTCQLVYPPKRTQCPNCFLDPRSGRSTNRYRSGGPVPFPNNTICPWCAGEGRKEKQEKPQTKIPKNHMNMDTDVDVDADTGGGEEVEVNVDDTVDVET